MPKYTGPSADLMAALLKWTEGRVGKPKDAYQGKLVPGMSDAWKKKQALVDRRMRSGPPKEWAEAQRYSKRYLGGGGGGRVRPGGGPSGGLPTWDREHQNPGSLLNAPNPYDQISGKK